MASGPKIHLRFEIFSLAISRISFWTCCLVVETVAGEVHNRIEIVKLILQQLKFNVCVGIISYSSLLVMEK